MKKLITTIITLSLIAIFAVGCATQAAPTATPSAQESTAPTAETPTSDAPASSSPNNVSELSGKVQMSGSTSMETIANALAESFMLQNPNVTVDVQLGGSSVGIKDALEGKSDIGNASRELKAEETGIVPNIIAIDGIAMVVNPANKVAELTSENLVKIYTGEIKNWKDVGGDDAPIVVIGREASSGTRGAFEELLKIEEQAKYAQELTETGAVKTAVSTTPTAIGYISLEALDDTVTALKIDGGSPTEEEIKAKTYPLSRPFIMAVKEGELRPEVKAFIDFVLSADGQAVVADNKLITVG